MKPKLVFLLCFTLMLSAKFSFGCTLGIQTISGFDEREFIFIGRVTGYTQPLESAEIRGSAFGLVVKLQESVYLPKTPSKNFEIFPLMLMADCSESGFKLEFLQKNFPLNAEIMVVAKEAEFLPKSSDNGIIRLMTSPGETGKISLNYDENFGRLTSADSIFDYKSYKYDHEKNSVSIFYQLYFELRKDLLRLRKSNNQAEKNEILGRLMYFPTSYYFDVYAVFKEYAENLSAYEHLYCQRRLEIEGIPNAEFTKIVDKLPKVCRQYKNRQ